MNGIPFTFLTKYSQSAFSILLVLVLGVLVQFTSSYKNEEPTSWSLQQQQTLGHPESYDFYNNDDDNSHHNSHSSSSSGRDLKSKTRKSSPRDFSALSNISSKFPIPKPSNIVAYHRSIHNTSWALTIPLFTFILPTANVQDPLNVGNQALYGFFAAVIVIIGYAVPILFNGHNPGARSLDNNKITLNHLMHPGHLMNLMGLNVGNQIGVDPMQCLQKTICDAYRSPKNERYGALAWPFQYFFPAGNEEDATGMHSIYRLAAREGKFSKTSCKKKYDCMFDVLDLANYLMTVYKKARKRAKEEESYNNNDNYSRDNLPVDDISNKKIYR